MPFSVAKRWGATSELTPGETARINRGRPIDRNGLVGVDQRISPAGPILAGTTIRSPRGGWFMTRNLISVSLNDKEWMFVKDGLASWISHALTLDAETRDVDAWSDMTNDAQRLNAILAKIAGQT